MQACEAVTLNSLNTLNGSNDPEHLNIEHSSKVWNVPQSMKRNRIVAIPTVEHFQVSQTFQKAR